MKDPCRLYAVRGAVRCDNTDESIGMRVPELFSRLLEVNSLVESDLVSVQFTLTRDLDEMNPATALRNAGLAVSVPLFAAAEPFIKDGLTQVVRVLLTYYASIPGTPLYLHGAEVLRPDLSSSTGAL